MLDLSYFRTMRFMLDIVAATIGTILIAGLVIRCDVPFWLAGFAGFSVSGLLGIWVRTNR